MASKRRVYLIMDNIRSSYNVGSLLRTAEGLGVEEVALCGITPYPAHEADDRPPYLAAKITARIQKTALGAETMQKWSYFLETASAVEAFTKRGAQAVALEQIKGARPINAVLPPGDIALVVGSERDGISVNTLKLCSQTLFIPMHGKKESFNVAAAGAMALFYLTLMV